ncbi:MAG: DUF3786 domain-containing protein [Thermoleophilia bacterium]
MAPTNEEKHQETYAAAEDAVRHHDPAATALRAGARWSTGGENGGTEGGGVLEFDALGAPVRISWPDLAFAGPPSLANNFAWRLIALHYLAMATGRAPGTDWVSYRELPDGLFYANTITREVEEPLARLFATDPEAFLAAGKPLGGTPADIADASLVFHPLPHVPVVFALWVEDDEFPAKMKVLYEREGTANLPLQDLRILADMLGAALRRGGRETGQGR